MNPPGISEQELFALIQSACDMELAPEGYERLAMAMCNDASARLLFLSYVSLDEELYWDHSGLAIALPPSNGVASDANRLNLPDVLSDGCNPMIPPLSGGSPMGMDAVSCRRIERSQQSTTRSERTARLKHASVRRGDIQRWIDEVAYRLVGTFVFWIILIIVVSPYLLSHLGNLAVKRSPAVPRDDLAEVGSVFSDGKSSRVTIATLTSAVDCKWLGREKPFEETDAIGSEKLDLLSGTVGLEFADGARKSYLKDQLACGFKILGELFLSTENWQLRFPSVQLDLRL